MGRMLTRRRVLVAANVLALQACAKGIKPGAGSAPATIRWFASSLTTNDQDPRLPLIDAFEKAYPEINIELVSTPNDTDQNRIVVRDAIEGKGNLASPDVYLGDVIWPAEFAVDGLALPLNDHLPPSFWTRFTHEFVDAASYRDKIYAVPFYADQGILLYRKDLLARLRLPDPPQTWPELVTDASILLGRGLVSDGFVWQGARYEGLTCVWTEFAAEAGAPALGASGSAWRIDTPGSLKALLFMRMLVARGISPADVTALREPQAEQIFQSGDAAFLRGWTSSYVNMAKLAGSPVQGKVGVAPLPAFGRHGPRASAIGGWDLYVNPHTRHLGQVLTFIDWATDFPAQDILAQYGIIPTNRAVRENRTLPHNSALRALVGAQPVQRPSGTPMYPAVSTIVYSNVYQALRGVVTPKAALAEAQRQLDRTLATGSR